MQRDMKYLQEWQLRRKERLFELMAKDNLLYYSFRLNVNNPQHVKVNNVLKDLDPRYKSRNQFLVDAAEFYIDHMGEENITVSGAEKKAARHGFVTRDEFDEMKEKLEQKVMTEARNEVIRLLGGVLAGSRLSGANIFPRDEKVSQVNEKELEDKVMEDLAGSWS